MSAYYPTPDPFDPQRVLFVLRLPGALIAEEVSVLTGFHVDAVNHFVEQKLIPTIAGKIDGKRKFSAAVIERLRQDQRWLEKAVIADAKRVKMKTDAQKAAEAARKLKEHRA